MSLNQWWRWNQNDERKSERPRQRWKGCVKMEMKKVGLKEDQCNGLRFLETCREMEFAMATLWEQMEQAGRRRLFEPFWSNFPRNLESFSSNLSRNLASVYRNLPQPIFQKRITLLYISSICFSLTTFSCPVKHYFTTDIYQTTPYHDIVLNGLLQAVNVIPCSRRLKGHHLAFKIDFQIEFIADK